MAQFRGFGQYGSAATIAAIARFQRRKSNTKSRARNTTRPTIQATRVKVEGAGLRRPHSGHDRLSMAIGRPQRRQGERAIPVTLDPHLHSSSQDTRAASSGQPSELEHAYRATEYRVDLPAGTLVVRIGLPHPDLDQLLADQGCRCWAYLTAYNPGSVLLTHGENQQRQSRLEDEVRRAGWKFHLGQGVGTDGTWPAEPSLLILDIEQKEAIALAQRYGQAALVYGEQGETAQLVWLS